MINKSCLAKLAESKSCWVGGRTKRNTIHSFLGL